MNMNMNRKSVTNIYRQQSVMTATPGELTLMLYNECIKDINIAIESINDKDMERAHNYISNSINIIRELIKTLDMRLPIAEEMKKIYDFINYKLIQGNIKKDSMQLKEALTLVEEFRNTWFQVIKTVEREGAKNAI